MWKENDVCMLLGCVNKSQAWPCWAWHSEFQISGSEDAVRTKPMVNCRSTAHLSDHMPQLLEVKKKAPRGQQVNGSLFSSEFHTSIPIHTVHHQRLKPRPPNLFPHDANITFDSSIRILLQLITLWIIFFPHYHMYHSSNLVGLEITGTLCTTRNSSQISREI